MMSHINDNESVWQIGRYYQNTFPEKLQKFIFKTAYAHKFSQKQVENAKFIKFQQRHAKQIKSFLLVTIMMLKIF